MNDLFPEEERRVHFERIELNGTPSSQWEHTGLDMRANWYAKIVITLG
jgi:hypothetical protein